jgi:bacillolysin
MKFLQTLGIKYFLFIMTTVLIPSSLFAQNNHDFWTLELVAIAKIESKRGWIKFRDDSKINPNTVFQKHAVAFGLSSEDLMVLRDIDTDDLGYSHYRYDQFYKGIQIIGGEYIVHVNEDGFTYSANGDLVTNLEMEVATNISEATALATAMNQADGNSFAWLDLAAEDVLQEMQDDATATYYPHGEMVLVRDDLTAEFEDSEFMLAWQFDIYMGLEGEARRIFIDVNNGQYLAHHPLSHNCTGQGKVTWDTGLKTIGTVSNTVNYILFDDCTNYPYTLKTWDMQRQSSVSNRIDSEDANYIWDGGSTNQTGVQAHWAMTKTRDYFETVHNRNSWDDNDSDWVIYNEANISGSNNGSCWNCYAGIASFGGGGDVTSPQDDWNTLDIVGHEFSHGVIESSAGLISSGESGALNESFADIFGEMVERVARITTIENDWKIKGDWGDALRNFADPNDLNDPDTYEGDNWISTTPPCDNTNDQCGIHTNSTVHSYWFYLLAEGGTGTNDAGNTYSVTGIGIDAARDIAYKNLTVYLTSNSNYSDAKDGSLQAAEDIYGVCSNEALQVANAWHAVNVAPNILNNQVCGPIISGLYEGIYTVTGGGDCETHVNPFLFQNVEFIAGDKVDLEEGFTATSGPFGVYFEAFIDPDCTPPPVTLKEAPIKEID